MLLLPQSVQKRRQSLLNAVNKCTATNKGNSVVVCSGEPGESKIELDDLAWLIIQTNVDIASFIVFNKEYETKHIAWIVVGDNPKSSWNCHLLNLKDVLETGETEALIAKPEEFIKGTENLRTWLKHKYKMDIPVPDYELLLPKKAE